MSVRLAYRRLVTKCTTENLWIYILRLLQDRPMYAYELSKAVRDRYDFAPATVTVYVVLYKMQREGLIRRGEERTVVGRPTRKYYQITDAGCAAYRRGLAFLATTIRRLEMQPPAAVDATSTSARR